MSDPTARDDGTDASDHQDGVDGGDRDDHQDDHDREVGGPDPDTAPGPEASGIAARVLASTDADNSARSLWACRHCGNVVLRGDRPSKCFHCRRGAPTTGDDTAPLFDRVEAVGGADA